MHNIAFLRAMRRLWYPKCFFLCRCVTLSIAITLSADLATARTPADTSADYRKDGGSKVYDDAEDEEMAFYGGAFKPRSGIAGVFGLTTNSFVISFNFVRQYTPDLIGILSIGVTTGRDPAEVDKPDQWTGQIFTRGPDNFPKRSGLVMLTTSVGLQQRLFRRDIVNSFRPFLEAGLGPTVGYIHVISRLPEGLPDLPQNYDISGSIFDPQGVTFGVNGYIGAGTYFGNNFLELRGISVRYIVNYLPAGVELLRNSRTYLFHVISINLIFGALFQ